MTEFLFQFDRTGYIFGVPVDLYDCYYQNVPADAEMIEIYNDDDKKVAAMRISEGDGKQQLKFSVVQQGLFTIQILSKKRTSGRRKVLGTVENVQILK